MTQPATLLLTRPAAQSQAFADRCRAAGWQADIVISPLLEIVPSPMPHAPPPGATLIFTSANGVTQAVAQYDLTEYPAFAVGDATAQVARDAGLLCHSAQGDINDLAALLAQHDTGPLLHLRGAHRAGDLAQALAPLGRDVTDWVIYNQSEQALTESAKVALAKAGPVCLPLFSPRTAEIASRAVGQPAAPVTVIAISAATAQAWTGAGRVDVVPRPNGDEMLRACIDWSPD